MERQTEMHRLVSAAILLFAVLLMTVPSDAGTHGNGLAPTGQFDNGMDRTDLQQFRNEADARRHCRGNQLVWGSSEHPSKFFTLDAAPERRGGFFACMREARSAGYEIVSGQ